MNHGRRLLAFGVATGLLWTAAAVAAGAVPPRAQGPRDRSALAGGPEFPQPAAARAAAQWLAGQLSPEGWMPDSPGSSSPSLSFTANTVVALVAADVDPSGAARAVQYLEGNVDAFVTQDGADGPGQLALLILDAEATGVDPSEFGGTDLVSRLLATEQPSGLFGTDSQLANYDAGNYEQGLALQALGVAGVNGQARLGSAISYLVDQQCPDGGWSFTDQSTDSCVVSATNFTGPDTNSTAEAVQGLAAQGSVTPAIANGALTFYAHGRDADGGWSYYPSSSGSPQPTDPDSTAFGIQALVALGQSPLGPAFTTGSVNPVSALLAFALTSGPGAGAFEAAYAPGSPDIFATYQAAPAVAGLSTAFPLRLAQGSYWIAGSNGAVSIGGPATNYGSLPGLGVTVGDIVGLAAAPAGRGYWEVAADGGVFAFGDAGFAGSMGGRPLVSPIVGMAATPDGGGYWEVAADGGVFAFGDAGFAGSLPGLGVSVRDIVGVAAAPGGGGYWEVAADGGIFALGAATFDGSMGGRPLNAPVVGLAATPDGAGYWEVAADGGVFAFGDAGFGGAGVGPGAVGMAASAGRVS